MKKVLSALCAVVMAFSLTAMPAFAAATPGQEGDPSTPSPVPTAAPTTAPTTAPSSDLQQIEDALNQGNTAVAQEALSVVVSQISSSNSDVSAATAALASKVLDATGAAKTVTNSSSVPAGITASATASGNASAVTLNTLSVSAENGKDVAITLDATMETQSELGVLMTVSVPTSMFNGVSANSLNQNGVYLQYNAGGKVQTLNSLISMSWGTDAVTMTFWVPHFSTYSIIVPVKTATSTPVPTTAPSSNNSNNNSSATAAPTAAPAANPIKATGADMNTVVVCLAVAATVALAGGMIVVKKNGMN